jgi:hypothetical protein
VQARGGTGKAAFFSDGEEGFELEEVHGFSGVAVED